MRIFISTLIPLIALIGLGCQSANTPASQAMTTPQRAIVVSGGNGGSTVVFLQSGDPAHPAMLSTSGGTVCPECKAAAIKYFETGVLEQKCSLCGATRTVAMGVPPNYGHN
jgi:hypothetical protein